VPLLAESEVVLGALFTVCPTAAEVTPLQLASPPYTAVIEWLPAESVVLANEALPPLTGTVAKTVAPSRNCTLPVAADGNRVAVSVTDWPVNAGLRDDTSAIDVDALFTVCVTAGDVLAPYVLEALYTAVIVWLPTANWGGAVRLALPPLKVALPTCVAPS
jgi:hypothetical protein